MKNRIRLTESTLRKIVKESVKKALNEMGRFQYGRDWRAIFPRRGRQWEEMRSCGGYAININNGEIVKQDDAPEEPGLGSNWAYLSFKLKYTVSVGDGWEEPAEQYDDLEDYDFEVGSGDEKIDSMVAKKFKKNIEAFFDDNSDEIERYAEYVETLGPDEPDYEEDDDLF